MSNIVKRSGWNRQFKSHDKINKRLMTKAEITEYDVNKREETRQRADIALPVGPPSPFPFDVEDIPITPLRGSIVAVASCAAALCVAGPRTAVPRVVAVTINVTTTTTTNQFFPTPQVGEYEEEEKEEEEKEEAFIPPPSTTPTAMTQSRTDRKRAPTMKALEAENTPKRGTGQGKGRGRDKDSTDRRGGAQR